MKIPKYQIEGAKKTLAILLVIRKHIKMDDMKLALSESDKLDNFCLGDDIDKYHKGIEKSVQYPHRDGICAYCCYGKMFANRNQQYSCTKSYDTFMQLLCNYENGYLKSYMGTVEKFLKAIGLLIKEHRQLIKEGKASN